MSEKNLKQKLRQQSKNRSKRTGFYYSFLTIVLVIFLIHLSISSGINIIKSVNYYGKIRTMKEIKKQAQNENIRLNEEITTSNSLKSFEAIARNNLKMADKDEVLLIINKEEASKAVSKKNKIFLFKKRTKSNNLFNSEKS